MTSLGLVWGKSETAKVRIYLVQNCVLFYPSLPDVVMNLTPFFQLKPIKGSRFANQKEGFHVSLNWNESINCFKGKASGLYLSLYSQ